MLGCWWGDAWVVSHRPPPLPLLTCIQHAFGVKNGLPPFIITFQIPLERPRLLISSLKPEKLMRSNGAIKKLKMIIAENIFLLAQFKNFSFSRKSHIPLIRYEIFYILFHSIKIESCDVMTILTHKLEYILEYIFLNHIIYVVRCAI